MIYAGSDSVTSFEQEILRMGPKIDASTVWSRLGASLSLSLEKRQSHLKVELINVLLIASSGLLNKMRTSKKFNKILLFQLKLINSEYRNI